MSQVRHVGYAVLRLAFAEGGEIHEFGRPFPEYPPTWQLICGELALVRFQRSHTQELEVRSCCHLKRPQSPLGLWSKYIRRMDDPCFGRRRLHNGCDSVKKKRQAARSTSVPRME